MATTRRVTIPYESLDPLTIGASEDDALVYRDELQIEIPERNLLAVIQPDEPARVANTTEAAGSRSRARSRARASARC